MTLNPRTCRFCGYKECSGDCKKCEIRKQGTCDNLFVVITTGNRSYWKCMNCVRKERENGK